MHRLLRTTAKVTQGSEVELPEGPPLSELVLATLRHHGVELNEYKKKPERGFFGALLPRVMTVTGSIRQWSHGGIQDDAAFAPGRYLQIADAREWEVMAWVE